MRAGHAHPLLTAGIDDDYAADGDDEAVEFFGELARRSSRCGSGRRATPSSGARPGEVWVAITDAGGGPGGQGQDADVRNGGRGGS
jgi:hypothetical protein